MPDKELERTRAGFGRRAAAYIIDRALLLIPVAILRLVFVVPVFFGGGQLARGYFLFDHSFVDVLCWLAESAYFVLLTWFCGATLGKMVMRLRVEREDGGAMRFIDVLYRETVGRFLSGILYIGYLMVLGDKQKRAFHDWLCGTCVVYDGVTIPGKKTAPAETDDYGWTRPEKTPEEIPAATASDYGWTIPGADPVPPADTESEEG